MLPGEGTLVLAPVTSRPTTQRAEPHVSKQTYLISNITNKGPIDTQTHSSRTPPSSGPAGRRTSLRCFKKGGSIGVVAVLSQQYA